MRHTSSRWPLWVLPVAFHGHPDFLMWQMHGLVDSCVFPCPTCCASFSSSSSLSRAYYASQGPEVQDREPQPATGTPPVLRHTISEASTCEPLHASIAIFGLRGGRSGRGFPD